MARPLVPFPIAAAAPAPLITDPFTGAQPSVDWAVTGDAVLIDGWGGTNQLVMFSQGLAFWGSNPATEQEPAVRSTRVERTFTGLPANRFVLVTVGVAFFAQSFGAAGKFIGMYVNTVPFAPNVASSETITPNVGQCAGFGVTNADGELTIAFAAEAITVSYDINIVFDNLTIAAPDISLERIFYDAGVLYIAGNAISITRDSFSFDPQEEWEDYDFPGKGAPVEGLEELVRCRPVLRGKFMLTGEYQFLVYRPDGTWADHASIEGARTYTPADLRRALSTALSLQNVLCVWRRPGDYLVAELPRGICRRYALGSADKNDGEIPVEIEGRIPSGSSLKTVPYRLHTFPVGTEL